MAIAKLSCCWTILDTGLVAVQGGPTRYCYTRNAVYVARYNGSGCGKWPLNDGLDGMEPLKLCGPFRHMFLFSSYRHVGVPSENLSGLARVDGKVKHETNGYHQWTYRSKPPGPLSKTSTGTAGVRFILAPDV